MGHGGGGEAAEGGVARYESGANQGDGTRSGATDEQGDVVGFDGGRTRGAGQVPRVRGGTGATAALDEVDVVDARSADAVRRRSVRFFFSSFPFDTVLINSAHSSTVRIGLENTSSSTIDFLQVNFTDALTTSTQAYLAENELPAVEAYEVEADALQRPVFRWEGSTATTIAPGASYVLEVKCRGKIGWCVPPFTPLPPCTLLTSLSPRSGFGSIQIDYGWVERDVVQSSKTFHTRRLFCDVFMTVHRAIVAHTLEVSRLKALPETDGAHGRSASIVSLGNRGAALDKRIEESLRDVEDGEHCLVVVDVANVYGKPFEVKLERHESRSSLSSFSLLLPH